MKYIELDTEQKLRIYTLPLRQRIIREMSKIGKPVTAKKIADHLGITPSAAQHHMKQLISIGLIEKDHTEQINGITANFMRLSNVTVRIGNQFGDALSESRKAFMDSHLAQIYASYEATVKQHPHQSETSPYGDVITGIVHLTDEDAAALAKHVAQFLIGHDTASETSNPWEVAMIAYRMDGEETTRK